MTVGMHSVMDDGPLLRPQHEPERPSAISSATSAAGSSGQEDDKSMHHTSRYKNVPHSTVVLMVISRQDDYLLQRIAALYDAFGDNFLVIWDNHEHKSCPTAWLAAAVVAATTGGGGTIRCIDHYGQPVSATHQFNYMGLGQERAMMWAMENRHRHDDRDEENGLFEHAWFLEDDVDYYPDISALIQVIDATGDVAADLLHQQRFASPYYEYNDEEKNRILNETGLPAETEWYHLHIVLNETAEHRPLGDTNITMSLMNLFRVSSTFLATMQDFYDTNHQQWTFFEALLPTLVRHHKHLTSALWTDYMLQTHNVSSFLRFRPCFTTMTEPGIYHPVKFRSGTYLDC